MWEASTVDLFCGAGGLTYGLETAGIKVAEGVDIDERCRYPFEKQTSARFVNKDIFEYEPHKILDAWNGAEYKVLVGCAPCQPYSTYSQKSLGKSKERRSLISRFATLIKEARPDIVSMENVPLLAQKNEFLEFKAQLAELDYWIDDLVIDCREYGIPQRRRRLVLLASNLGAISMNPGRFLDPASWTNVKSTIGHLPELSAGEIHEHDKLHRTSRLSEVNLQRIRHSLPGGTWRDWPKTLRSPCHQRESGRTYGGVYGRMEWEKPSPTITGQCYAFGTGRFGHPTQDRALSLREAALLQTFPYDYEFYPSDERFPGIAPLGRLIGNAVPPVLGNAIGESIVRHIDESRSRRESMQRGLVGSD
ncbi:MAG: DNA cytosine methyltransferase [Gammaproteobacteria bacterium]|nr:DNA cytosine methyltransferase [Gammaproteobacteria bacterium]